MKTKEEIIEYIEMLNDNGLNQEIVIIHAKDGIEVYAIDDIQCPKSGLFELKITGRNITNMIYKEISQALNHQSANTLLEKINSIKVRTRYYSPDTSFARYCWQVQ